MTDNALSSLSTGTVLTVSDHKLIIHPATKIRGPRWLNTTVTSRSAAKFPYSLTLALQKRSLRSWLRHMRGIRTATVEGLLQQLFEEWIPRSFTTPGPGYFAYVPGGGLFPTETVM